MKRPHKIIVLTFCTIFSLIQVSLAQELTFDENTVALWRFDEGEGDVTADESDNQYQLDLSNGAAWTEEGWSNSAADMTDEDARLTSDLLIGNGWDALSIDAYIYPTAINNEHPILYRMDWHNVSDPSYYLALYAEGQLAAGVYLNNPGGEKVDVISENGVIETDEWYKVSMTWSTGEPVRIYLNDELIAESNEIEDGTVRSGNDPMRVGCGYQGRYGWFYFQGLIDEVRVSNVDRSHLDEPRILHVPDDYETIQEAIDDSQDGDIVLVDPGEYVENIDFIGKSIIVSSLFLIDGNENYIAETIIDGDEDGSVVTFDNGETEDAVLTGFTIRNGNRSHGGGIYCLNSNPALSNLSVIENSADEQGGGIYCFNSNPSLNRVNISENSASDGGGVSCERSNPLIVDVTISNNSVTVSGGGIYCGEAHPRLERVLISGNSAGDYGGGVHIVGNSSIVLDNVTVSGNSSDQSGGAIRIHVNSDATIHNSILYGNSAPEIALGRGERNNATLSYSDIEGGRDDIEIEEGNVNWGEGNIDADPLFADPDDGNYHLTEDSPCIDAGDPDSPEDPDDTRADMGAFYYHQSELSWRINIAASAGDYSDNNNYAGGAEGAEWDFDEMDIPEPPHAPQNFIQVYFPHPDWEHDLFENFTTDIVPEDGYVDNTIVWEFQVNTDQEDETVTLTFNPEDMPDEDIPLFLVDPTAETIQDLWDEDVYEYNSGEGGIREFLLVYGITPAYMEREFHAGWSLLSLPLIPASNNIDDVFGDDIDDPYFVFGYSREEGFYLTDEVSCGPGYWLASYADVTLDVEGLADSGEVVMELDLGWNLIGCPYPWVTPLNEMHIIDGIDTYTVPEAADAGLIQNILYTRQAPDNEYAEGIELEPWYGYWFMALDEGLRLLLHPVMPEDDDNRAPDRDEPDEGTIESWDLRIVAGIDGAVDRITRLGVDTSATDGFDAAFDYPEPPVPPSGTYITAYFDYPDWNEIIGRRYNRDIRQVLEPANSGRWTLTVTTSDSCEVMLSWHDISLSVPEQFGFTLEDPVNSQSVDMFAEQSYSYISTGVHEFNILVEAHDPANANESCLGVPTEYYLSQAYPNPFNTFTKLAFGLPAPGMVEITVWDIGGRRIRTLTSGSYQAGRYEVIWNAGNLPTGLYLAKIRANQYSAVRKMLLVK